MSKAKKLEVKKSVIDWCKQQVAEGKQLAIHWEGGGDSGWCYFQINGHEKNNEYTEYLTDMMYSELDYGSWAGEFSANGEAIFSVEESAFVGVDYYSEDDTVSEECKIELRIPKDLWFDSVSYQIEADTDEHSRVEVTYNIKNGFHSAEHHASVEALEKYLEAEANDVIDNFCNGDNEYRGMWDNNTIERSEFKEEGDVLVYTITNLDIRTAESTERDIYLEISEEDVLEDN